MSRYAGGRQRTRVKICGLTRAADAGLAVALGADAVGVVFAESPRRVTLAQAAHVLAGLPPFVARVGVFAGEDAAFIREAVALCPLDCVQVCDGRPANELREIPTRIIRVLHVRNGASTLLEREDGADALLLDAPPRDGQFGGTGQPFDWTDARRVRELATIPVLVAGGLTPENVGGGIATLRPWGVDVSSGVEAHLGVKDPERLGAFFEAVRKADAARATESMETTGVTATTEGTT